MQNDTERRCKNGRKKGRNWRRKGIKRGKKGIKRGRKGTKRCGNATKLHGKAAKMGQKPYKWASFKCKAGEILTFSLPNAEFQFLLKLGFFFCSVSIKRRYFLGEKMKQFDSGTWGPRGKHPESYLLWFFY